MGCIAATLHIYPSFLWDCGFIRDSQYVNDRPSRSEGRAPRPGRNLLPRLPGSFGSCGVPRAQGGITQMRIRDPRVFYQIVQAMARFPWKMVIQKYKK